MGILLWLFSFLTIAQPPTLAPIDARSRIAFETKNLGVTVKGTLTGMQGTLAFNPNALENSFVKLSVRTASIQTGISLRDRHLLKEDYLFAEKYPTMEFTSDELERRGTDFLVKGRLKIRGVTKAVTIPFKVTTVGQGYEFEGTFSINRQDFGIGKSAFTIADHVAVSFTISVVPVELSRSVQTNEKNNP